MPHKDPVARRAYIKKWITKDKRRKYGLKNRYGITPEQYNILFDKQQGKCSICIKQQPQRKLSVDHDHRCCKGRRSCGKCIRGLLCVRCNTFIAQFEKMQDKLPHLKEYIDHRESI
jgi:hypothetical protein